MRWESLDRALKPGSGSVRITACGPSRRAKGRLKHTKCGGFLVVNYAGRGESADVLPNNKDVCVVGCVPLHLQEIEGSGLKADQMF